MAPLTRVVLLVLTLGLGVNRQSDDPKQRTPAKQISDTLDVVFSLAVAAFLSVMMGAFRIEPLQSRGYDAIPELLMMLGLLGLKAVLFVVIPAILLCLFLNRLEGLAWRLVVYGVFAALGAFGWHLNEQRLQAKAAVAARQARATEQQRLGDQHAELTLEQARAAAAQREAAADTDYRTQLLALSREVQQRWRDDIESAGAIGKDGEVPKLLHMQVTGNWQFRITNNSRKRICLELFRVLRRGKDVYHRCEKDWNAGCREMAPLKTLDFSMYPERSSPACSEGQLEFRIGTPFRPEPSWWSRSAIDDFDRHPPDLKQDFSRMDTMQLRAEIAILEKLLADEDRAARWRQELNAE